VAAAGDQAEERRLERIRFQEVRGDVALEVVDAGEGLPARRREGLGGRQADEQGADHAGPAGDRDGIDAVQVGAGLVERRLDDRADQVEVVPGRDLGDDAPEPLVRSGLRRDDVGPDLAPVDHRGAGVVAGGLEGEYQAVTVAAGSSHMMRASSPLSW